MRGRDSETMPRRVDVDVDVIVDVDGFSAGPDLDSVHGYVHDHDVSELQVD